MIQQAAQVVKEKPVKKPPQKRSKTSTKTESKPRSPRPKASKKPPSTSQLLQKLYPRQYDLMQAQVQQELKDRGLMQLTGDVPEQTKISQFVKVVPVAKPVSKVSKVSRQSRISFKPESEKSEEQKQA
jgi:hypothetical protein